MKIADVPQDNDPSYEGEKKLYYAQNEKGQFVAAKSNGWHVEETVKNLAWQTIENDLKATKLKVIQGEASALRYYMKYRQMDTLLLAQNMQISRLRVWWHLKPQIFKKLNAQWLQKYADCLEISVQRLKNFDVEGNSVG